MKFPRINKLISLCLVLCILISALCSCSKSKPVDSDSDTEYDDADSQETEQESDISSADSDKKDTKAIHDKKFTLNVSSDKILNPYKCNNSYDSTVSSLLYETLFVLDDSFDPQSVLCKSCTTDDGLKYTIELNNDVYFHNGSKLTANDVSYSIYTAMNSSMYSNRFNNVNSVYTSGNSVIIELAKADYHLTQLLDIPIIANNSADDDIPSGTGLYCYKGSYLAAFPKHRDYAKNPIENIYLSIVDNNDVSQAFTEQKIDLLSYDPTSSSYNIHIDYEARYYQTTVLQYLGFNMNHFVLSKPEVRRAISYAVDREYIAETVFNGHVVASPLIFHPYSSIYNEDWEKGTEYSLNSLSDIFVGLNMEDKNLDGHLEYPAGGILTPFSIDFIVNDDNELKIQAAGKITDTLKSVGIDVDLRILPWDEYIKALQEGKFDMYYAETRIGSDFDLSNLLSVNGPLNYGKINDETFEILNNSYLGSSDKSSISASAASLASYISTNAFIIPIAYEEHAVLTHRGMIDGISPVQSGVFWNISDWKFSFDK